MARDVVLPEDAAWRDRTSEYRSAVNRACTMQDVPQVSEARGRRRSRRALERLDERESCLSCSLSHPSLTPRQHKHRTPCAR
jgi:hypothetical protein